MKTQKIIFTGIFLSASALLGCRSRDLELNTTPKNLGPGLTSESGLTVLIIVDQMRSDYLDRFEKAMNKTSNLSKNEQIGLQKIKKQGVWFSNAMTAAAPTVTAAGHASICSGSAPNVHGIVANTDVNTSTGETKEFAKDDNTQIVFSADLLPADPLANVTLSGSSSSLSKVPSISSLFRAQTQGNSVAISLKDRGAVFCGVPGKESAYWFDFQKGQMVTSSFYASKLPKWAHAFNAENPLVLGKKPLSESWEPTLKEAGSIPSKTYGALLGSPNDQAGMSVFSPLSKLFGPGFPHVIALPDMSAIEARKRFQFTPFANKYLTSFALKALASEKLGQKGTQDLLVISYSTPDLIGHEFGPDGVELMDTYLQLNIEVERLMQGVASQLKDNDRVIYALSADHGIQRLPELQTLLSKTTVSRLDSKAQLTALNQKLDTDPMLSKISAGLPLNLQGLKWVSSYSSDQLFLNPEKTKAKDARSQVNKIIRNHFTEQAGISNVYSAEEVMNAAEESPLFAYRRGYFEGRSGDYYVVVKKGWLSESIGAGNHGSIYEDDRRIPMAFFGTGIPSGKIVQKPVFADDIAPTLFELNKVKNDGTMKGKSLVPFFFEPIN